MPEIKQAKWLRISWRRPKDGKWLWWLPTRSRNKHWRRPKNKPTRWKRRRKKQKIKRLLMTTKKQRSKRSREPRWRKNWRSRMPITRLNWNIWWEKVMPGRLKKTESGRWWARQRILKPTRTWKIRWYMTRTRLFTTSRRKTRPWKPVSDSKFVKPWRQWTMSRSKRKR